MQPSASADTSRGHRQPGRLRPAWLLRRLDEARLDRLHDTVRPSPEDDALGKVSEENEVDLAEAAWSYFTRHGFDGDDDPLLRCKPPASLPITHIVDLRR